MRIAQISTLASPVRRAGSHSIEHLVWLLTEHLVQLGHEVTVFAAAGSRTRGELVATLPGPYAAPGSLANWQTCEMVNLSRALQQSDRFDVLHSHAYLWGLPLEPLSRAPMVHTLHVQPFDDEARLWAMSPGACVTAISGHQWSAFPDRSPAAIIPHGVEPSHFRFRAEPDDYLCFLGRLLPEKGTLEAVAVARELGMRLVIAGPETDHFREHVMPLVDGARVQYVGVVSGAARSKLLGGARALLYPLRNPEPFGLVQVEAMFCGTPVAAVSLGAVAEVIDEGVTGSTAATHAGLAAAVRRCLALDRRAVRRQAEARFTAARMAREYTAIYERVAERRCKPDGAPRTRRPRRVTA